MSDKIAVLDFGEYETRIGFAGDDEPVKVFPTVVDHKCPITQGIVTNWDQIEKIIKDSFNILNVKPEDTPVLITESPAGSKANREKWTDIMLETFDVPSLYIASQPYLSLAATGRDTGMVLCISEGFSYAIPVYESVPNIWAMKKSEVTGAKITECFTRYLTTETGNDFGKPRYKHDIGDIKEKYFYVAKNYDEEKEAIPVKSADWHNENITICGTKIPLNEQCFQCPELLFQPELNGLHSESIAKVLFDSIMEYQPEMRSELCSNIVLSGGVTMMNGFTERLNDELTKLIADKWKVDITAPNNKNLVWKGGSVVASRPGFNEMLISKDDYDEYYNIFTIKCFT